MKEFHPKIRRSRLLPKIRQRRAERLAPLILCGLLSAGCAPEAPEQSVIERVAELRRAGQYGEALAELRAAARAAPDDAELRRIEGSLYLELEDWSLAEIAFNKAVELGDDVSSTRVGLAQALVKQEKFAPARDALNGVVFASNEEFVAGTVLAGQALDRTGDRAGARSAFARLVRALDGKALPHGDAFDAVGIYADLDVTRAQFRSLREVLEQRERLRNLPRGVWTELHKQRASDAVFFSRQQHGGSAFDTRRGQLILFGSDTHDYGDIGGKNWKNNLFFYDPVANQWQRSYARDSVETYAVNADGIPVAGENGEHPWAMHTYGAVTYDERRDELIVSSHPAHLEPGRFTYMLQKVWPAIRRHPTWTYKLQTQHWHPLNTEPQSFFQYATAYDPDREIVLGYRDDGVFELAGEPRAWRRVADTGLLGPDNNMVYDTRHKSFVIFGSNGYRNDVAVYQPGTGRHELMPTRGLRPPPDRHVPMAYHPQLGKTVMLVQRRKGKDPLSGVTETWLYDLDADAFEQVATATIDFGIYRNYNLEYDAFHDVLLFIPNPHGPLSLTRVLALRL